jgi:hypothetical protein
VVSLSNYLRRYELLICPGNYSGQIKKFHLCDLSDSAVKAIHFVLPLMRGGLLPLKQKNLSQRRGLVPFVISTSWSLAGWLWHLAEQVAGRSSGQFPRASLHGYLLISTSLKHKFWELSTKNELGNRNA